ncbi:MAG: hypothetical protein HKN57_01770 [Xanthomonadales bacterium]|nr:hypothetical protein [Gammaproteobacteria bacterium]MBT8052438.1 hypothetical protein [Gammaproteobacteria bacterium]NND55955.1 hypothetical protein [Xanthomonadales bacterium]NNK50540.1 hypothetical protein [Xanthomonadales bacterium]
MVEDSRRVLLVAQVEYWRDMIEANKQWMASSEKNRMSQELERAEREFREFCAQ